MTTLVTLSVLAYLTARTFVFPGVPILLGGDQGFFWMYASRMLHGELPYRDFFQFTPPGADLAFLAAFRLFGERIWVTNAVLVTLGAALGTVCFRVARGIMGRASAALATAIYTVLVFGQALSATHHSWSALAVMSAVALASGANGLASRRRLAFAGVILGFATFCTQSHGVAALAAFVGFIVWQGACKREARRRVVARCLGLLASYGVTLCVLGAYFVARVGVAPMMSWVVVYVWRHVGFQPPGWGLVLPEPRTWASYYWFAPNLVVHLMVPAAYVLVLVRHRSVGPTGDGDSKRRDRVALLWLVGVALLAEVTLNLSSVRLFAVSMPAIILFVWAIDRIGRMRRAFSVIAWVGVACLGVFFVRSTERHHAVVAELPGGRAATDEVIRDKLVWVVQHDPPGGVLFAANRPHLYLPLGLRNPLFLDAAVPWSQTTDALVARTVTELEASKLQYVLWSNVLDPTPASSPPLTPDDLGTIAPLRSYLYSHYHLARAFADGDAVWERDRERN